MTLAKTQSCREPQDLSHLIFQCGLVGSLTTLSCVPVIAGDSFEDTIAGSFNFSPMRRNLTLDPKIEIFSFYVPHRHIYGDDWVNFLQTGLGDGITPNTLKGTTQVSAEKLGVLALSCDKTMLTDPNAMLIPTWRTEGYDNIMQNYFVRPNTVNPKLEHSLCHIKNLWTAPLAPGSEKDDLMNIPTSGLSLYSINHQAAVFNNAQKREHFAVRYRDLVDSFGGKTTADVDQRPTLLAHTEMWGSGYDVDGTSETSLGQFTGRVKTKFTHQIPRFFCGEHGAIWTLVAVRFPPIAVSENHFLVSGEPSYDTFACDPVAVANAGWYDVDANKIFSGTKNDYSSKLRLAHSQWYREHPSFVNGRFSELKGYPFLEGFDTVGLEKPWQIDPYSYNTLFQTDQLLHWQVCARSNAVAIRNMPTSRQTFMFEPSA